jgi:hypothetical protein
MIQPEDAGFHPHPPDEWRWCETNMFPFCIPEAGISATIYVLTRPALGVCMSDVTIQDRIASAWEDQIYVDNQQHLPCPASLTDYALPNGLSVRMVEPLKRWHIRYQGIDDTEFDLQFASLMPPFDMNDPAMDPMAAARHGVGWEKAFHGHYEITGRITGRARIRGTWHDVDCIDTLDRSWGPRPERDNSNAIWFHGSFGEALTVHALVGCDPARTAEFGKLISGYVLENGAVHGLVSVAGRSERHGPYPMSSIVEVEDVRGKRFRFTGATMNAGPWAPYPSIVYYQCFMRWNLDGLIGYGIQQDVISRAYLTRHRAAR